MSSGYYRDESVSANIKNLDVPLQLNCTVHEIKTARTRADSVRKDFYMIYLCEGEFEILTPVRTVLHPGEFLIFQPDIPFTYQDCGKPTTHYSVHFTGYEAENLLEKCGIKTLTVYKIGKPDSVFNQLHGIFRSFLPRDKFFDIETATKLSSLLISIGRIIEGNSKLTDAYKINKFRRSLEYINENVSEPITVQQLAKMEFLSESHYRALFVSVMKQSPLEYITSIRINSACRLLRNSRLSISEVGKSVGYPDQRHFSRVFKRLRGVTPSEFRNGR